MQVAGQNGLAPLGHPVRHQHGFGRRGGAVVHGGVGDLHGCQHRHLRLELEQVLQRALRDLGLVGRVGGEKFRALDQVIHRRRHVMLVGARADEERHRPGRHVLLRHPAQDALHFKLALGLGQVDEPVQPLVLGHVGKQRIDVGHTDLAEHGLAIGFVERQVAHQLLSFTKAS